MKAWNAPTMNVDSSVFTFPKIFIPPYISLPSLRCSAEEIEYGNFEIPIEDLGEEDSWKYEWDETPKIKEIIKTKKSL